MHLVYSQATALWRSRFIRAGGSKAFILSTPDFGLLQSTRKANKLAFHIQKTGNLGKNPALWSSACPHTAKELHFEYPLCFLRTWLGFQPLPYVVTVCCTFICSNTLFGGKWMGSFYPLTAYLLPGRDEAQGAVTLHCNSVNVED